MELNLCPTCNAFVNASWDRCVACGAQLRAPQPAAPEPESDQSLVDVAESPAPAPWNAPSVDEAASWESAPVIEYTPEPEPVPAPESQPAVVAQEGFASTWSIPGDSTVEEPAADQHASTPAASASTTAWYDTTPTAATVAGDWAAPDDSAAQQTDMQPVHIQWPTPASAPSEPIAANPVTPSFESAPSFYAEPPAAQSAATQHTQTFHYNAEAYAVGISPHNDGRIEPIGKGKIIALAIAGPIILLVLCILVVILIGSAATSERQDSDGNQFLSDNSPISAPPFGDTKTTEVAPAPATPTSGWINYSDPAGHFSAKLPSEPSVATNNSKDGPISTWTSTTADGQLAVVIAAGSLPAGNYKNNQQVLENALNGAVSTSKLSVKGKVFATENGILHLDALLSDGSAASNVRFFVSNNTLYGVSVTSDGLSPEDDAKAFDTLTKSFTLLNGKKPV